MPTRAIRAPIRVAAWAGDAMLAVSDDKDLDVHDTRTGAILFQIRNAPHKFERVCFTGDGRSLVVLGGPTVATLELWIYPLDGTPPERILSGLHGAAESCLDVSRDGGRIVAWCVHFWSGHEAGTLIVWERDKDLLTYQVEGQGAKDAGIRALTLDPDDATAILVLRDGAAERWRWPGRPSEPERTVTLTLPAPSTRKTFGVNGRVAAFASQFGPGCAGTIALPAGPIAAVDDVPGMAMVVVSSDASEWAGVTREAFGDDAPLELIATSRDGATSRCQLGHKIRAVTLSPSGRRVLVVHDEGTTEIITAGGGALDLAEDARIERVAAPRTKTTPRLVAERRRRALAMIDAGIDETARQAYRGWLAQQDVELWQLLGTTPKAELAPSLVSLFHQARTVGLEPRVEDGLLALRPFRRCLHWQHLKELARFTSDASLAHVDVLEVTGDELATGGTAASNPVALALAESRRVSSLVELSFHGTGLRPSGARALIASPHLTRLRALSFSWEELGASVIAALRNHLPHLRSLRMNFCFAGQLSAKLLGALGHAACAGNLRWLELGGNGIRDDGAIALAETGLLDGLSVLRIGQSQAGNALRAPGVAAIVARAGVRSLVALDVSGNRFARAGVTALLESPHLGNLRALDLSHVDLDGGDIELLARRGSTSWPRLTALYLAFNRRLDGHALAPLGESALASQLTELDLSCTSCGDDGATMLATSSAFSRLQVLRLYNAGLEESGRRALAESLCLTDSARAFLDDYPGDPFVSINGLVAEARWLELHR